MTPGGSGAADPRFVPLGAPVWLGEGPEGLERLWVAQDTGGAIKGANRFDTFWGAGDEARQIAGGMSASARAVLLLPRGPLARLGRGDATAARRICSRALGPGDPAHQAAQPHPPGTP